MTTGHAPDDWLDIPPPHFGPGTGPDADGSVVAAETAAQAAAVGDLPTGEIQVVDVPDAEDGRDGMAGVPTGKMPVVDLPEPDLETGNGDTGNGDAAPGDAEGSPGAIGLTMTGQFRAVAAALAAELVEPPTEPSSPTTPAAAADSAEADEEVEEAAETAGAVAGDDGVDVAGVVEVPEPPAPQDWRVPVLRSRRTPPAQVPPDALPDGPAEPAEAPEPVEDGASPVGASDAGPGVEEAPADAGTAAEPVGLGGELGPRARRRIEAHRNRAVKVRRQRGLAVVGLALLVTTGTALGMVGVAKVRGSTGGRYVDPKVQPDEPGYVALVTPTPTLLVVHRATDRALSGVSLLSLHAQDEGGSVIVMPVSTMAPFADAGTTFAEAYAESGSEGVTTQVELTLNVAVGETVEVDDARWAALLDPVAPIAVDLDRAVGNWPAGGADIPANQVGTFLATRADSETELARLDRQELFWETWLPAVRAGGRNAVPGEVDVGLGRFVRGLAAGDTDVTGLPVSAAFSAEEMYSPTEEMLPDLVAQAVPYPQEPSRGSRVHVQLLNGTSQRDLTTRAATSLVAGGAEIALVGNAASFAEPTTRFVYATAKLRDDADKLRDAFGVGEVVQAPADEDAPPVDDDRIDVTVILGADALDASGG